MNPSTSVSPAFALSLAALAIMLGLTAIVVQDLTVSDHLLGEQERIRLEQATDRERMRTMENRLEALEKGTTYAPPVAN